MQGLVTEMKTKYGSKIYGFIDAYDGERYFFNSKSLSTEVHSGDEVKFKGITNEKGNYAIKVQLLEE